MQPIEVETSEAETSGNQPSRPAWLSGLPELRREIWILALGQLLLYIGQGFTLVYASIYFVNELGFSPTQVGLALGASGVAGIFGRIWVGYAIDSEFWGRRRTLMLAAVIPALACFCLAVADTFAWLVTGNLLLGLGLSIYWPANLAITTDLTTSANRMEAFALTRLVDNLGLGVGALLAGQYMAMSGNYSILFLVKGLTYLLFGGVVFAAIAETRQPTTQPRDLLQNWWQALSHRDLLTYLVANLCFTLYTAQQSSTLPLYLADFVAHGNRPTGFSEQWISYFFAWHALLKIILQLPITRRLKALNNVLLLLIALAVWTGGFGLIWLTGIAPTGAGLVAIAAFTCLALAEIIYSPASVALVSELAPVDQRGIYFALDSQCWSIGFMVGPVLGGWALDHPETLGADLWLWFVAGGGLAAVILLWLRRQMAVNGTAAEEQAEEALVAERL
ncbi:MAG: MFS transporter [Cyanobacteria bacterium P01_G01_bin.54]